MNTFFLSTIIEWSKTDLSIRISTSLSIFKGRLLQFVRSLETVYLPPIVPEELSTLQD